MESTRAQEAAIRQDTDEQLSLFRKYREEAEKSTKSTEGEAPGEGEHWVAGSKKRRKGCDREQLKGVKFRRSSQYKNKSTISGTDDSNPQINEKKNRQKFEQKAPRTADELSKSQKIEEDDGKPMPGALDSTSDNVIKSKPERLLGLAGYSSDDD